MANDYQERMDRIERNMEFIVEHQAKFSADMERINSDLDRIDAAIGGLLRVSQTLVDHQKAAEARTTRLEEKMAEMAKAHKETEERLSAFIMFVEKYISSHDGH